MDPNMEADQSQVAQLSPPAEKHVWFTYSTGDRPLDGYTIKRGIGAGGFGEVYYAVSDGGKEVALKQIQRHLDVELRGVSQCLNLKHPNLVVLYDVKRSDRGENWVVMEFVSGENLADTIERYPDGMPVQDVLRLLRGICDGVGYLHEHGIVHRDLKPGNIFIENDLVKIGDYGLAKFISASRRSGQTESVGTVHYMAPELAHGRYGKEIDLYAVGIILHEMLTGRVPFVGQSPGEILMKHLTAQPDTSILPTEFQPIVSRLLAKSPEMRYSTFDAMLADLDERLAGRAGMAPPIPPIPLDRPMFDRAAEPGQAKTQAPSLHFWLDEVHGGLSTAEGIIRFAGDCLHLSFRVQPLGMMNLALQELKISLADVSSVGLQEGWFTTKLVVNANRAQAIAALPSGPLGQATLRLARRDRDAARQFIGAVNTAIAQAGGECRGVWPPRIAQAAAEHRPAPARSTQFVRPPDDRVWLGVCSGLAARLGIDPVPFRILFVLLTIFPGFLLVPVFYLALALLMPDGEEPSPIAPGRGRIRRLVRPASDRRWSGVCSGIAAYFGIDPIWIRVPVLIVGAMSGVLPAVLLYFIFHISMPEGEPTGFPVLRTASPRREPGSLRCLGRLAARIPIALVCGGGVGAIVAATCQVMGGPWDDEIAAFLGVGTGLITAAVTLCGLSRTATGPRRFWPALTTLMLGAGTGLATAGMIQATGFANQSVREMVSAFGGVGGGLLTAAFTAYLLYSAVGRALGWRWFFVIVFLGAGAGLVTAACGFVLGTNEVVVTLCSVGAGLLTAGGLTWILVLGGWAERLRPVSIPAAGLSNADPQDLKRTMTWYGSNEMYRPVVLGTSLFLTVLLVAWTGAYGAFWLAGHPHRPIRIRESSLPAPQITWEVARFGGHRQHVEAVAFDPLGKRLATGDSSGVVKVWDLNTAVELQSFAAMHQGVHTLRFSPDGTRLAAAAGRRAVIWEVETGEQVIEISDHPETINCLAFNPDGNKIATGSSDDAVRLIDAGTGRIIKQYFGTKPDIQSVAFTADGDRLMALGRHDHTIRIWEIATARQLKPFNLSNIYLTSFVLSADGRWVAARDVSTVYILESATGKRMNQISASGSTLPNLVAFGPDGSQIVSANWPQVQLHDSATGRLLCSFKGHTGTITSVGFHPSGDSIVSAGTDNTVRLWEIPPNLRSSVSPLKGEEAFFDGPRVTVEVE